MLTLTDTAREAINVLTADEPAEAGVRIATDPSRVDGQSASVTLALANGPEPDDEVLDEAGTRVFVQPAAAQLLGDQTLDAQVDVAEQQVSFFVR